MNESGSSAHPNTIGAVVFLVVLSASTAVSQVVTAPPQINAVVNSASFTPVLAPGDLISIFGANLANVAANPSRLHCLRIYLDSPLL